MRRKKRVAKKREPKTHRAIDNVITNESDEVHFYIVTDNDKKEQTGQFESVFMDFNE